MDIKDKKDTDNTLDKLKEYWNERDSKFKRNLITSVAILVVAIGVFIFLQTRNSYDFLLSSADSNVSANVLSHLREQGIKYEVRGQSIYVADVNTDELKLELSGSGVLSSSDSTIDLTGGNIYSESQQKTLIKKDLENTLKNTIKNYKEVKNASVIITLGEQSAFKNDNTPSKAAIQLELASNLSSKQVKSIQALVAASVPNLTEDGVVITDNNNNLLSSNSTNEFNTENNEEYKLQLETKVSSSIKELLSVAFPGQNYKVVTTMDINFDQTKIEKESVQSGPDTKVSETTVEEVVMTGNTAGQAGTGSNVPDYETPLQNEDVLSSKRTETINYELNKVKEQITKSPEIRRLSVSVIVDKQLSDEERATISELVSTAALVDLNRGDVVTVAGANVVEQEAVKPGFMESYGGVVTTVAGNLPLILLAIFIFIVTLKVISMVKDFIGSSSEEYVVEPNATINIAPQDTTEPIDTSLLNLTPKQIKVREFVKTEMADNPEKVASVLQMIKDGKIM